MGNEFASLLPSPLIGIVSHLTMISPFSGRLEFGYLYAVGGRQYRLLLGLRLLKYNYQTRLLAGLFFWTIQMARRTKVQIALDEDVVKFNELKDNLRSAGYAIAIFSPAELKEVGMSQKIAEQLMVEMVNG